MHQQQHAKSHCRLIWPPWWRSAPPNIKCTNNNAYESEVKQHYLLVDLSIIYVYYRWGRQPVQHLADAQVQHQAHQKFRTSHDWWEISGGCTWSNMCTAWIDGPHQSWVVHTGQKERRWLFVFLCVSNHLFGVWWHNQYSLNCWSTATKYFPIGAPKKFSKNNLVRHLN